MTIANFKSREIFPLYVSDTASVECRTVLTACWLQDPLSILVQHVHTVHMFTDCWIPGMQICNVTDFKASLCTYVNCNS